jgi:hypothetical protein
MTEFKNEYIRGKSLEELIDGLIDPEIGVATSNPGSPVYELTRLAIHAKLVDELARPQRWAWWSMAAAVVSAIAAVASVIANV